MSSSSSVGGSYLPVGAPPELLTRLSRSRGANKEQPIISAGQQNGICESRPSLDVSSARRRRSRDEVEKKTSRKDDGERIVTSNGSTTCHATMFMIWGDWFLGGAQSVGARNILDSVIVANETVVRRTRVPTYEVYKSHWRIDPEIQRHYWAASFLLPIGSIFVLALVVLLMVLFKRCPQMVAAIVASILGVIIIFATLISLNHAPIYS